ncbi:hypothetical protein [Specibacter sp. RAF43]|uniref:hypothetical protein n=1 Tax=Specibacter sp. RAF43 TaxID=3233057 RepID=UPI003F951E3B
MEISTRMRPGEWTPQSLSELVGSYQGKLRDMGAPEAEIDTEVVQPDDGSVSVRVSWKHAGVHTYASLNQDVPAESANARGDGEAIPVGEVTEDSKGLGAVFGDAERSAIDAPPSGRAVAARQHEQVPDVTVYTDDEGHTHVENGSATPRD